MYLNIDIQSYLKFPLNNGFIISEYKNHGMAEFCKLDYSILTLDIWRDRIDYSADIVYDGQHFNTTHLANFLNNKTKKYSFISFSFETQYVDAERFLTLLNKIFAVEFDVFLEFLFNLTTEKQIEFVEYCNQTNSETTG